MSINLATFDLQTVFAAMYSGKVSYDDVIGGVTKDDLYRLTDELFETINAIIAGATDSTAMFIPHDPAENTPGWTLGHVVVHLTASLEECAALASLLSRRVSAGESRLRYETSWETIQGVEQVRMRLDESARMCKALLDSWPDAPHQDFKLMIPGHAAMGPINAIGCYMLGVFHTQWHLDQLREIMRQASTL